MAIGASELGWEPLAPVAKVPSSIGTARTIQGSNETAAVAFDNGREDVHVAHGSGFLTEQDIIMMTIPGHKAAAV